MFAEKSAVYIAEQLYAFARQKNKKDITLLKLMKLLYIAHGCKLAVENSPLFSDKVEAWKHGPVIPSVYHALKNHTNNIIDVDVTNIEIDKKNTELFGFVIDNWGHLNGFELSNLTNLNKTPWDISWNKKGGKYSIAFEINNEDIKKYYKDNFFNK